MQSTTSIGQRLRLLRRERGLTQGDLAERAGLSTDMISRIERDERRPSVTAIYRLAAALSLSPSDLLGRRERMEAGGRDHGILRVRDAVLDTAGLPGLGLTPAGDPSPPGRLAGAVAQGWDLYWKGHLSLLAGLLPPLIGAGRAALREHGEQARGPLAQALQLAACLLVQAGHDELAYAAARSALRAADAGEDRLQHAAVAGTACWVLMHQGRLADAARVALAAAEAVEPRGRVPMPHLTVHGSLLLWAAAAHAAAGDASAVDELMGQARAGTLAFTAGDRHDYHTNHGPSQMAMQACHQGAVLGRPGQALAAARRVNRADLHAISWGSLRVDVATACLDLGQVSAAIEELLEAHEASPEWCRHQGGWRALAASAVRASRRRNSLTERLAAAAGIA